MKAERRSKEKTVVTYCGYCKEQTEHKVAGENDLRCKKCGSARLHKIQGFDASLM